jgi:Flp pilus assembly protein TadD
MFRLLIIGMTCALLTACAGTATVPPETPPPGTVAPEPVADIPERAFPDDAVYPLLLAEFALRRRAYDVALDQYMTQAPRLRDAGVSAHTTHLAQFMAREGEALEAAQLWVELDPENVEANNTLAILLLRSGRSAEALPHLALLARKGEQPNFPTLLSGFDELNPSQQADLTRGIEDLAIEFPDNVELLLTRAMLDAEQERFEQAQEKLEQVFLIEPDNQHATLLEARILLAMQAPQPYARLERILAANPEDQQLRLQYARLLTATDMEAAKEQFEILSTQSPRDGELLLSLALINRETGDNAAAKTYLHQLLALEQHVDDAHYQLGRIAEEEGDPQGAIYEYKQVEDGREFFVATNRIGVILLETGQADQHSAFFAELRERYPDRLEQLFGLEAELLSQAGQAEAGMAVLNRALSQLPASASLRYARSMLAEQQGNLTLMEADLRLILASEPNNTTALNALGYTLANRTKRYEEAHSLISRAILLQPNEPAILDSMGWVLYRMNRNEEALKYLTRAYAAFPDPEVAAHLGEVLWVSGNTEAAKAVFQGALLAHPDNEVLAATLSRLSITDLGGAAPVTSR